MPLMDSQPSPIVFCQVQGSIHKTINTATVLSCSNVPVRYFLILGNMFARASQAACKPVCGFILGKDTDFKPAQQQKGDKICPGMQ